MIPVALYTPIRVSDGQGGYVEAFGAGRTIWIDGPIPGEEVRSRVDSRTNVNQGDVIAISSKTYLSPVAESFEHYRVVRIDYLIGSIWKVLVLEKIDRPLNVPSDQS